jgi:hypothetical protein
MELRETRCEDGRWMVVAWCRVQWRAVQRFDSGENNGCHWPKIMLLSTLTFYSRYRIRKSASRLSYVTVKWEGKMQRGRGSKTARVCLSMCSGTENIFPLLISTQSVAF